MASKVLTVVLIVLLNVSVGCYGIDKGKSQLIPPTLKESIYTGGVKAGQKEEIDIVEQVSVNRQAYRQALQLLIEHYNKIGNNMKLRWAKKELAALNAMPQYKYIIEAEVAGPDLKASTRIPEADDLYKEAVRLEKKGNRLILVKDNNLLRLALDKYNQLIRKHPSSDKIDDAAYRAGKIYEYFKDYRIALIYYKRTYQWDAETTYPARFREARILDQQLHNRAEALQLYKQAIEVPKKKGEDRNWQTWVERRIKELSETKEGSDLD